MYTPQHFSSDDETKIRELIRANGFVTVLSFPECEAPYINHLPVILSATPGEEKVLLGHMAKRNPQWQHFKSNPQCTMIVHGPHTYITPTWYKSGRDVPTWNYAAAHLRGRIELVEGFDAQIEVLKELTAFYEGSGPRAWEFELPDDLLNASALTSAIISFKFHIEKSEAKFKFSQNRSDADRLGVIEGLGERTDDQSRAVREIMLANEKARARR